jgi:hypothetical protein
MTINANVVRVRANPYSCVDHDGEPMGVYPEDPDIAGGARRWVGASLDLERTRITEHFRADDPRRVSQVAEPQITKFVFDEEPVMRPMSKHYQDGIRTGALIACDEVSAKFGRLKDYLEPAAALERERTRAVDRWVANYGSPPPFATTKTEPKAAKPQRSSDR